MCNVYKCGLIVQCLFLALEEVTEVAFENFCEPERGSFHSMATRTSTESSCGDGQAGEELLFNAWKITGLLLVNLFAIWS